MSDTDTPTDFASTLGEAVNCAMIRYGHLAHILEEANQLLDAGDTDKAIFYVRSARSPLGEVKSVQSLIYACLPRTGDKPDGGYG